MALFFPIALFILLVVDIAEDGKYEYVSAKTLKAVIVIAEIACICGCFLIDGGWARGIWTAAIVVVSFVYLDKQDKIQKDSNQTQRTNQTTARTTSTRTASTSRTYASTPSPTPSAPVLRRSDAPDITISGVRVITKETVSLFPNLTHLTIGSGVQEIAPGAFKNHPTLSFVTFYTDINTIGKEAFEECSSLQTIRGINRVREIGGWAFCWCFALKYVFCDNNYTDLLTSIGQCAFIRCNSLECIDLPESVSSIGERAFGECSALPRINIPAKVKVIDCDTFNECKSLKSVSFSKGLTHIGVRAFFNCGITSLHIPDTVVSIGELAFGINKLQSLSIPNSVTSLGDEAFCIDPNNLNYIKMPARFKERSPQIITFYEYLSPSDIATKITYIQQTTSSTATPAASISLNPEVFRYGGKDRELRLNAWWHDGKVYCGTSSSNEHRIIGYYDNQKNEVEGITHAQIGYLSKSGAGINIRFDTSGIYCSMLNSGLRTTAPDPDGNLAEIISINNTYITSIKTDPWLAKYQGDPWGACAAFVCLIYQMHHGVIDSKYSRFYTDYMDTFH